MTATAKILPLVAELERRRNVFRAEQYCFPEQLAFIRDKSRFKSACCSRRAGKSIGAACYFFEVGLQRPGVAMLYLAPTLKQAKRILWKPLKDIAKERGIACKFNDSEFTVTFENGSILYLSGAKDATEVSKYLGYPLALVIIDESQAYRAYLQELVDDVLSPTLYDYNGSVALIGTPGPVPAGFFYEITKNDRWANHHWTMFQNPHLKIKSGRDPMELVLEDCERMGLTLDSPRIQRNAYGRWVVDSDSLVFRYAPHNHFADLPDAKQWQYTIGVDLGWSDADAIAVIGWNELGPQVYLVEEWIRAKSGITELATELQRLVGIYEPLGIVMDTAGLGTKIAEECRRRFALPIEATKKSEKFAHIELLNDAMRRGHFLAKNNSRFAQDCYLVEWDRNKSTGDRLVISSTYHSDICDAVLYAYRKALGWLHEPPKPKVKNGSDEWRKEQERAHIEYLERQMRGDDEPSSDPWGDEWATAA